MLFRSMVLPPNLEDQGLEMTPDNAGGRANGGRLIFGRSGVQPLSEGVCEAAPAELALRGPEAHQSSSYPLLRD